MHERAALRARENGLVDRFRVFFLAKDHTATGTAKSLVSGGSDKIGVGDRALMEPRCHQTGDMRHIDHQKCPGFMGDLRHFSEVDLPRIGGSTGNDHFRSVFPSKTANFLIIDPPGLLINAVGHKMEIFSA